MPLSPKMVGLRFQAVVRAASVEYVTAHSGRVGCVDHRRYTRRELEDEPDGGALLGRSDRRARGCGAVPVEGWWGTLGAITVLFTRPTVWLSTLTVLGHLVDVCRSRVDGLTELPHGSAQGGIRGYRPDSVRRDKAPFLSGCESRPATVAPAGSNRSGRWRQRYRPKHSDDKGRPGRLSDHAGRNDVNAEQASKLAMRKPTRPNHGEGCQRSGSERHEHRPVPPG